MKPSRISYMVEIDKTNPPKQNYSYHWGRGGWFNDHDPKRPNPSCFSNMAQPRTRKAAERCAENFVRAIERNHDTGNILVSRVLYRGRHLSDRKRYIVREWTVRV